MQGCWEGGFWTVYWYLICHVAADDHDQSVAVAAVLDPDCHVPRAFVYNFHITRVPRSLAPPLAAPPGLRPAGAGLALSLSLSLGDSRACGIDHGRDSRLLVT